MKILALKFKYLGDIAVMTPSLRALRERFPEAELHVLVAEEAAPILEHLPWLDRVWKLPRVRGRMALSRSWPVLKAMRAEKFDRSVDFVGNDRGAILSLFIGAKRRLGLNPKKKGFLGRSRCYHETAELPPARMYEPERDFSILQPWDIPRPENLVMEMRSDPSLAEEAERLMPHPVVLCHLSTSQPKKEWPIGYWLELEEKAKQDGVELVFSSGASPRERGLLEELRKRNPGVKTLPIFESLDSFLAVLDRIRLLVAGDTGPLHFAAALGKPTLALFGPSISEQWAPRGPLHICLTSSPCRCSVHASVCSCVPVCMETIEVEQVLKNLNLLLEKSTSSTSLNL